jgi:phage portal protein BeeE
MAESIFKKSLNGLLGRLGYVQKKDDKKAIALVQPYSMYGGGVNPLSGINNEKGVQKPGKVSFAHLRKIAQYDSIIRICVQVIKKEVSQSEWNIVPAQGVVNLNKEHAKKVKDLFVYMNQNGENMRVLLDRVLEDLLILDAGVIEKVFNAKGELQELNSVDAATIRPVYNQYGELDQKRAYVQVIDDKVVAEFALNEIIYMMANPQNDVHMFGYGLSPIESILLAVQASLNADVYNARTFSEDNIPPGILDLGGCSDEEANQFIALWNATVVNNTQKLKFVWGSDNEKKYIPFKQNNKDMQFVEYNDWLSRVKLASYGLTSQDANITADVNRATSEVMYGISQSRGVRTVKRLVEEYWNREIVLPMGYEDVQFQFIKGNSLLDQKAQADIDSIYIMTGVTTPEQVAQREGLEPAPAPAETTEYGTPPAEEPPVKEDKKAEGNGKKTKVAGPDDALEEGKKAKKGKVTRFKPLY